ncbi:hypothetical protein COU57_02125 [Candidatus Pacearchaeota archaeon CG10_big_fil_rev_8_21_14_0_10_32_14]|nr:MAG: hypothetical protein COU57_02125 [Candidatus Pacearchaeota archaeon CG10_big_fil_rev_8_21_14_0_10_32_14]
MRKGLRNSLVGILTASALYLGGCAIGLTDEKDVRGGQRNVYDVSSKIQPTTNKKAVVFVIDTSGSMDEKMGREKKIDSAKRS